MLVTCCLISVNSRSRRSRENSHLRLSSHILIQRDWVVSLGEAIVHVVEEIDARGTSSRAVVVAAGIVAGRR